MPLDAIIGIALAAALVLAVVAKLIPKRQPKEKTFKCSRCNATSRHTGRTIEAWRNNKTQFFCQGCHAKWLASQPPRIREQHASRGSTSGCFGVVALCALLPLGCLIAWAHI